MRVLVTDGDNRAVIGIAPNTLPVGVKVTPELIPLLAFAVRSLRLPSPDHHATMPLRRRRPKSASNCSRTG